LITEKPLYGSLVSNICGALGTYLTLSLGCVQVSAMIEMVFRLRALNKKTEHKEVTRLEKYSKRSLLVTKIVLVILFLIGIIDVTY